MLSRRDFMRLASLVAPGLLLSSPRMAAAGSARPGAPGLPLSPPRAASARPGSPSLGLFFDAADLPELRRRFADPMFAGLRRTLEELDRPALRRFLASEVRFNDHLYDIAQVGNAAQQLSFYYAMTGDEEAADLGVESVRTLMKFPRWDYFIEAGEHVFGLQRAPSSTMAVVLSADWLGDRIEAAERDEWLRVMGERGLEPSFLALYGMRHPERVVGWTIDESSTYFEHRPGDRMDLSNWPHILDATNLKAVPASALAIGTAAYRQRFGAGGDADRWLEQALYSLRTLGELFTTDGSYNEGVSYAHYTTLHMAQAIDVLHRVLDVDLFDLVNWPGYAEYIHEMSMATSREPGGIVNFGDSEAGASSSVLFWAGARGRDGRSQWTAFHADRDHDSWSLIWYDPAIPPAAPPAGPRLWHSDLDWIIARTGYRPEDLLVAMRSGGPANHEHADRGSIIVKAFGEELVTDPMRPPYSFSDPAWMMRTTAGHSALLIDGQGHQYHDGREGTNPSHAVATIVRKMEREGFIAWTSDATPAYRLVLPDVASVTRTVVVLHELPAVLVFDKVHKSTTPSTIQARFFGYNNDGQGRVEAAGSAFTTFRPGATLRGIAFAPGGARAGSALLPIPEETGRKFPFAEAETQEASLSPALLTVLLPEAGRGGRASADVSLGDEGSFVAAIRHGGQSARVRFFDTGTIPEFDVDRG